MDLKLRGKTAVITGASAGIGTRHIAGAGAGGCAGRADRTQTVKTLEQAAADIEGSRRRRGRSCFPETCLRRTTLCARGRRGKSGSGADRYSRQQCRILAVGRIEDTEDATWLRIDQFGN